MSIADIDVGLYSKLTGTSAITTLVGQDASNNYKIYYGQAPAKTTLPYIVFQEASGLLDNDTPHQDMNCLYDITAVSSTKSAGVAILTACHNALHHNSLTITGWTVFQLVQENQITLIDNIEGTQCFRVVGTFRIRASIT